MVSVIVGLLILIPIFGIGGMNELVVWLVKINSVCMPLRYLWVFVAYIALKRLMQKENRPVEYQFVKSPVLGKIIGGWCFLLTAVSCLMGIYSENRFELILNIVLPICLIGLGFILPRIAGKQQQR